jgi:hypothetical protein
MPGCRSGSGLDASSAPTLARPDRAPCRMTAARSDSHSPTLLMPSLVRPIRQRAVAVLCAVASLSLFVACSDAPTGARQTTEAPFAASASQALSDAVVPTTAGHALACASTISDSSTAVIGPRGGIVSVAGSALVVPPGAVRKATAFTFVVPASPIVEIEVHPATGGHYQFAHPVAISVSYARCADSALPASTLGAWWIDDATRQELGVMAGIDDRDHRRLTFITDHLSGYIVAY